MVAIKPVKILQKKMVVLKIRKCYWRYRTNNLMQREAQQRQWTRQNDCYATISIHWCFHYGSINFSMNRKIPVKWRGRLGQNNQELQPYSLLKYLFKMLLRLCINVWLCTHQKRIIKKSKKIAENPEKSWRLFKQIIERPKLTNLRIWWNPNKKKGKNHQLLELWSNQRRRKVEKENNLVEFF